MKMKAKQTSSKGLQDFIKRFGKTPTGDKERDLQLYREIYKARGKKC